MDYDLLDYDTTLRPDVTVVEIKPSNPFYLVDNRDPKHYYDERLREILINLHLGSHALKSILYQGTDHEGDAAIYCRDLIMSIVRPELYGRKENFIQLANEDFYNYIAKRDRRDAKPALIRDLCDGSILYAPWSFPDSLLEIRHYWDK